MRAHVDEKNSGDTVHDHDLLQSIWAEEGNKVNVTFSLPSTKVDEVPKWTERTYLPCLPASRQVCDAMKDEKCD